jgi:hypothetical protein
MHKPVAHALSLSKGLGLYNTCAQHSVGLVGSLCNLRRVLNSAVITCTLLM